MKKSLLVIMALVSCLTMASAEKMAAGAGYYAGFPNVENNVANLFGAFFQYDFNDWLGARAGLGNLGISNHEEVEQTYSTGSTGMSEFDLNANAFPYISIQILASLVMQNGRVYFGPGYFTANATGEGDYTESGGADNNYSIDVKKLAVSGISFTLGGRVNVSEMIFLYGEAMVLDSYQAEHEYEYSIPGQTYTITETGKTNGGFTCLGIGAGFMF